MAHFTLTEKRLGFREQLETSEEIRREIFGPADVWTVRPSTYGEIDPAAEYERLELDRQERIERRDIAEAQAEREEA